MRTAGRPRRLALLGIGGLILLTVASCGRGANQAVEEAAGSGLETKVRGPWIEVEKTGGVAGFRLRLLVWADGRWRAENLARGGESEGAFPPATVDSLSAAMDALGEDAWGAFPSTVMDDFQYIVRLHHGETHRVLDGGGQALPEGWDRILRILDRPYGGIIAGTR